MSDSGSEGEITKFKFPDNPRGERDLFDKTDDSDLAPVSKGGEDDDDDDWSALAPFSDEDIFQEQPSTNAFHQPQGFTTPEPEAPPFTTWEKLVNWWLAFSKQEGFCIRTENTDRVKGTDVKRKGRIVCNRAGIHVPKKPKKKRHTTLEESDAGDASDDAPSTDNDSTLPKKNKKKKQKRKTKSKKCNCGYFVDYALDTKRGIYKINGMNLEHNHPPVGAAAHVRHRKLSSAVEAFALALVNKMPPSSALIDLKRRFPACLSTYEDMRNLQKKAWKKERQGLSATEAMLEAIASAQMPHQVCKDETTGELNLVMITDPMAIVLAQEYGQVLLMDCTYKTNKYNYPLLHIVSHTPTGNTFTVAYGFMKQETTQYYAKALKMLRELVPELPTKVVVTDADQALRKALAETCPDWIHHLCRWHLSQNIKKNCRTGMDSEEWNLFSLFWRDIIESRTVEAYEKNVAEFKAKYATVPGRHEVWEYSMSRLVPGEREKYVACWVDQHPHLGNTSTSRAEGGHSKLKKDLKSCRGDFFRVVEVLRTAIVTQQSRVFEELHNQRTRLPDLPRTVFSPLLGVIVEEALGILHQEFLEAEKIHKKRDRGREVVIAPCDCNLRKSIGLLCYHQMLSRGHVSATPIPILPDRLARHWRLRDPDQLVDHATALAQTFVETIEPQAPSRRKRKRSPLLEDDVKPNLRIIPSSPDVSRTSLANQSSSQARNNRDATTQHSLTPSDVIIIIDSDSDAPAPPKDRIPVATRGTRTQSILALDSDPEAEEVEVVHAMPQMYNTLLPYGVEKLVPVTQQMRKEIRGTRSPPAQLKPLPKKKTAKSAELRRWTTSAEMAELRATTREQAEERAALALAARLQEGDTNVSQTQARRPAPRRTNRARKAAEASGPVQTSNPTATAPPRQEVEGFAEMMMATPTPADRELADTNANAEASSSRQLTISDIRLPNNASTTLPKHAPAINSNPGLVNSPAPRAAAALTRPAPRPAAPVQMHPGMPFQQRHAPFPQFHTHPALPYPAHYPPMPVDMRYHQYMAPPGFPQHAHLQPWRSYLPPPAWPQPHLQMQASGTNGGTTTTPKK